MTSVEIRESTDFASAFAAVARARPNGLITLVEVITMAHRREIGGSPSRTGFL